LTTMEIIAATDGSDPGTAAVRWAAREAARQRRQLRIIHAFEWESAEVRFDGGYEFVETGQQFAEAIVAAAVDEARRAAPTIRITSETLVGRPVPRLSAAADGAEILVLGNRGRGGFTSLLLGSVSRRVATHVACSVVVVRGNTDDGAGPVVVGCDDSPHSDHVLETAFEAADARGASLTVVRAYLPPTPLWPRNVSGVETPRADERSRVQERLAPWQDKYPEVTVETIISHDGPAPALIRRSHESRLVIVGSHDHGALANAMLGSTGTQLLHHAGCPVYIARPHLEHVVG